MISPLVVTMVNFYMTHLENNILDNNPEQKPSIYCRYIDNCFMVTKSVETLIPLKDIFERHPVLHFTHEIYTGQSINFLDVHLQATEHSYITFPYQKSTDAGIYLPQRE